MWKRNQSMMAALARRPAVEKVIFVNPEVSLATPPARLLADLRSIRRHAWRGAWPHRPAPGVLVLSPVHWIPFRRRIRALGRIDRGLVRSRLLRRLDDQPFLLLLNGVREETLEVVDLVSDLASFQVFDWSDDFAQFHKDPAVRAEVEARSQDCIRQADLVLAVNQNLASRARALGARVEVVINATGLRPLSDGDGALVAGASTLARELRRPLLGYVGFINEHRVDHELVTELARRHPEWTLFFLGLVQLDFDRRFRSLPNVVFHPPVPHGELADYMSLFDVCLIPHLDNPHTAGNNPLKLYDYLTTGRPIVTTRVAGLEGFEDLVEVATDRDSFIAAVEAAVAGPDPPGRAANRRARAAEHTWEARAAEVEAILLEAVTGGGGAGGGAGASTGPEAERR
jgi:glycosyltransferase involved in cell wall biosynthesis